MALRNTAALSRGAARALVRAALSIGIAGVLVGCQSFRSWGQDCADVYSGVRYFSDLFPELPADGKLFFGLDLPLTAIVDTLALPATAFMTPEPRRGGFPPGCRWASPE